MNLVGGIVNLIGIVADVLTVRHGFNGKISVLYDELKRLKGKVPNLLLVSFVIHYFSHRFLRKATDGILFLPGVLNERDRNRIRFFHPGPDYALIIILIGASGTNFKLFPGGSRFFGQRRSERRRIRKAPSRDW